MTGNCQDCPSPTRCSPARLNMGVHRRRGTGWDAPRATAAAGMPLFRGIAAEIEGRVGSGVYSGMLPSVLSLSAEFGVARGTVEQALDYLAAERALLVRSSRGWCVQQATRPQDVSVVRSFAQWARAIGASPSGMFVSRARARATAMDTRELGVKPQSFVLRVVRVRALDGRPVMIEHQTFPGWLIDPILGLDHDAPSIADAVFARHGLSGPGRPGSRQT